MQAELNTVKNRAEDLEKARIGAAALVARDGPSGKVTCGQRALIEARKPARWRSKERAFPREKEPVQRPWGQFPIYTV